VRIATLVFAAGGALAAVVTNGAVLTGGTSRQDGVFSVAEKPELFLRVSGLNPLKDAPDVNVAAYSEDGRCRGKWTLKAKADKRGNDAVKVYNPPQGTPGVYIVKAELADGTKLSEPWSEWEAGEYRYAVVKDRDDPDEADKVLIEKLGPGANARRVKGTKAAAKGGILHSAAKAPGGATLFGDTSYPKESVFFPGEKISLQFTVTGLEPLRSGPKLNLRAVDDRGKELWTRTLETVADQNGCDRLAVDDPPQAKLGYYRIDASLAGGTGVTEPWSTRRDGMLTYAIVRDPEMREYVDEDVIMFFGSGDKRLTGPLKPSECQKGCKGWGVQGQWRDIDKRGPGTYAAMPQEEKDETLLSRHVMLLSGMCNNWKKVDIDRCFRMNNHADRGRPAALTPEGEQEFEKMLRAWVPQYKRQFADRKPRIYEVSSEWYKSENGSRTIKDIVRVYEIAWKVISELDPEGYVCGAGYDPYGDITREFLKAGLGAWMNALTVHPYYNPDPGEPNGIIERVREAKEMVKNLTGKDLPVFNTEFGFATHDIETLEPVQMKHIVRIETIFAGEGWKSISLFTRSDYRQEPGFGYMYNLWLTRDEKDFGGDYTAPKTSPKQVYPAVAAMTWFLANRRPVGDIPYLGETVWGYAFKHAKTGVVSLALWDWSGNPNKVKLDLGRREAEISDHMGNVTKAKCGEDGLFEFELTDMPVYVFDVDAAIWDSADGERARRAKVFNEGKEAERRAKGIEIVKVCPVLAEDGSPGLKVDLKDLTGRTNEGMIAATVKGFPESDCTLPYRLAADSAASFTVPMGRLAANPLVRHPTAVTATMKDGRQAAESAKVNFLVVPRFRGSWNNVETMEFDSARQCLDWSDYYTGSKDFSAGLKMAYDDEGLLLKFHVKDDMNVPSKPGVCLAEADALKLALAKVYLYEKTGNTLLDEYEEAQTLYSFGFNAEGRPCGWRHVSYDHQKDRKHPVGEVKIGENGYELKPGWELRIPWHAINCNIPKPGDVHAIGLRMYDYDAKPNGWFCGHGAFGMDLPETFGAFVIGR